MIEERWLTPAEVAVRLQVSVDTVMRQLRAGALPGRHVGRQWRVHPAELDAYLRPPGKQEPHRSW
jgi:excisionase family DNA binding protein